MPKPFRRTVARRSSLDTKARAAKNDRSVRGLYHRVGPAEFWHRRLCWLVENGKWVVTARIGRSASFAHDRGLTIRVNTEQIDPRGWPTAYDP